MTFPPGGLSTWKPPSTMDIEGVTFAIGDVWQDPIGIPGGVHGLLAPLTIKDLACPTWGLGRSTSADGTVITTIGPPWLPLIVPPVELFSLDPMWASICTGLMTDSFELLTFALFDPPMALTRGSGLVPAPVVPVVAPTSAPAPNHADPTTVPENQVASSTVAAKPASSPTDPADPPARTGDPMENPGTSLTTASAEPTRPISPPGDPAPGDPTASPTDEGDLPAGPKEPQPVAPAKPTLGAKDPPSVSADAKAPTLPTPQQGDDSQTQGLGAIIYSAFGNPGPEIGGPANKVNTISVPTAGIQKISIGGGQILSIDPSGLQFEGKTYSVGGPAITLSHNVYTLVPQQGSQDSAMNDEDGPINSPTPIPDTLTIAGHTVVPNPTGMIIAGSNVLPGGSAITISNTRISLDPSGVLIVGSSAFSLPPQSVFTIGTQAFTADPTGFVLNSAKISPGAATQTVDGTIISLDQSGVLAIGSSTVLLPTPTSTQPIIPLLTVAGQTFTPNPTAFSIAGTTIFPGGPAATVDGTVVSLRPFGNLVVGSSTIPLPAPLTPLADKVLSIAGQTFTPNPSAFSIAGTTISAGGPAVTIAGTIVSLQPSGTLIVGSSTIPLSASQKSSIPLLSIGGLGIKAQSSFAVINGVTIGPDAPGITVNGSVVSMGAGGATLDVGTGRFAMTTRAANVSNGLLAFEGGQGRRAEVSLMSLLIFGIGGSLMLML